LSNYYEPFLGGGALYFAICGRDSKFSAHLSDVNTELVNAYQIAKTQPEPLLEFLSRLHKQYRSATDKEKYYYEIRAWTPPDKVGSAARFIFLNKTCYNGLYRVNKKGGFNVPFGQYKAPTIFKEDNIRRVSHVMNETSAHVYCADFKEATEDCKRGDFVYFDPPYDPATKTSAFTDYTIDGFTELNQADLADLFGKLADRGCGVLLSNSDTPLTRKLYGDYRLISLEVSRPISCLGKKRKGFHELIVYSVPDSAKLPRRNR